MRTLAIGLVSLLIGGSAQGWAADAGVVGEVVDRTALRVCADPANLPFSNEREEGFENEIAELLGAHLGLPVTYVWYPQTIGFLRQTLRSRLCDLVIGVVAADELVQNTNPYYRSTYVLAVRDEDAARLRDIRDPAMRGARIGVVAGTPPADMLSRAGLLGHVRPYQLQNDSRHNNPLRRMVEDLASGEIDVALGWGPPVGYWAARSGKPITLVAVRSDDPRLRTDFRISMGVRWGEPKWKKTINDAIGVLQPEITRILEAYDVPLLDEAGHPLSGVDAGPIDVAAAPSAAPAAAAAAAALPAVGEPAGYRMEAYRAAVPATLDGATVLDTEALVQLIADVDPLLVDVLPKQRQPEGAAATMPWMEKKRAHLPGSIWLPNTGYGELSAEFRDYFEDELAKATGGDLARPVVFYCDANCWMSWNAAKRAMRELGYTRVYWYPEGVGGWEAAGLELVEGTEVPMPDFVRP